MRQALQFAEGSALFADVFVGEPVDGNILPSQPDKFIEWHKACAGEAAVE